VIPEIKAFRGVIRETIVTRGAPIICLLFTWF
jgi:hypothetical protein